MKPSSGLDSAPKQRLLVTSRTSGRAGVGVVVAALLLGVALVVASLIVVRGIEYVKTYQSSRLDVTGSADRVVTSDQVKWTARFGRTVDAGQLRLGYQLMAQDLETVLEILEGEGFSRADLGLAPISVTDNYRECYNAGPDCVREVTGHELGQWFTLSGEQVAAITALAQDAQAFVEAGVGFQTTALEYYYSGLAEARPELLAEAIRDAQARAQAIATATGSEIGPLQSADSGVFQVTQLNSTEVTAYGMYDTSTIDKRITAVVHASFTLR